MSTNSTRSEAQREASRTNGAQSQGPRTPEGKARSSQNAIKHGIYSTRVVLTNENPAEYQAMLDSYIAEWRPVGQTEADLLLQMVNAMWRMHRLSNQARALENSEMYIQHPHFNAAYDPNDASMRQADAVVAVAMASSPALDYFSRAEKRFDSLFNSARRQLLEQQKLRLGHAPQLVPQPALALPDEEPTGNEPRIVGNHCSNPETFTEFSTFDKTESRPTPCRRDWKDTPQEPPEDKAA